jgi:hypothetical protein
MCYFLYGSVNPEANEADLEGIVSGYHFCRGDRHAIIKAAKSAQADGTYRIGHGQCDCDTPVGAGREDAPELRNLASYFAELRTVRNIKYVYIIKNWAGQKVLPEQAVHIDDIEPVSFLAALKENCLYKIELFQRY